MALIKCPECGKKISDMAVKCPNCGCPKEENEEVYASHGHTKIDDATIFIFVLSIIITIIMWCWLISAGVFDK